MGQASRLFSMRSCPHCTTCINGKHSALALASIPTLLFKWKELFRLISQVTIKSGALVSPLVSADGSVIVGRISVFQT